MPRCCLNFQWCSIFHSDLCSVGTKIRLLHARPHQFILRISPQLLLSRPRGVQQRRQGLSNCPRKAREHHGPADNHIFMRPNFNDEQPLAALLQSLQVFLQLDHGERRLVLPLTNKEQLVGTSVSIQQREVAFSRILSKLTATLAISPWPMGDFGTERQPHNLDSSTGTHGHILRKVFSKLKDIGVKAVPQIGGLLYVRSHICTSVLYPLTSVSIKLYNTL
jgi:hypothetical protein